MTFKVLQIWAYNSKMHILVEEGDARRHVVFKQNAESVTILNKTNSIVQWVFSDIRLNVNNDDMRKRVDILHQKWFWKTAKSFYPLHQVQFITSKTMCTAVHTPVSNH